MIDSHGDIGASAGGPDGLFHSDTRYLSHLELLINGLQPLLLGSNLSNDNCVLTVDLTNPDMFEEDRIILRKSWISRWSRPRASRGCSCSKAIPIRPST